jgi:hypothetical protein
MYKFKELKAGRRLYVGGVKKMEFFILGITFTKFVNGYLKIGCENRGGNIVVLFIPINHINANNVRVGNNMIFTNHFEWSKYATDMINRNAICSLIFGLGNTD